MSSEESPAQRSARLRRERREGKIKDGGSARLDKILGMGGRSPMSDREEASPSPQSSTATPSMPETGPQTARQVPSETQSPEAIQAQQEYFRSLLRQSAPGQGQQGQDEDQTMKLLGSLLGGVPPGDQSSPGAGPGPGPSPDAGGVGGGGGPPGLSPADIATSLGVPPFIANMLRGAQPQSEAEKKELWRWKVLHVVFSVAVAVYLLFLVGASVSTYGGQPPPPATAQNPFVVFVTGEMVLSGARILVGSRGGGAGLGMWVQIVREVIRDGSVVLFLLGMGAWWHRGWVY